MDGPRARMSGGDGRLSSGGIFFSFFLGNCITSLWRHFPEAPSAIHSSIRESLITCQS